MARSITGAEPASRLSHVYWLGGSPCSGKSTVAAILGEQYGLQVYDCDAAFEEHRRRATPGKQPELCSLATMTWEEIWMRPVERLLEHVLAIYREEFAMIIEDIIALPASQPVLAEGAALLPELVTPLLADRRRAAWVVPTEAFQWAHYSSRPWIRDILKECSDPEAAFRNWMGRDAAFAREVTDQAAKRGLQVIRVDGSLPARGVANLVARQFGLARATASKL